MTEFLSVPHHQLLLGLGLLGLLLIVSIVLALRASGASRAAAEAAALAAQHAAADDTPTRLAELERRVSEDFARARSEAAEQASTLRGELQQSIATFGGSQREQLEAFGNRLKAFEGQVEAAQTKQREGVDVRLTELRDVFVRSGREQREEIAQTLTRLGAQQEAGTKAAAVRRARPR